jgi:hypothetical protein
MAPAPMMRANRGGSVVASVPINPTSHVVLRKEVGPMQEIIDLIGFILRCVDIILKVLSFFNEKREKSRNHPH